MPQSREVTSDFLYVRLEGDRRKVNGLLGKVEVDRDKDIASWAQTAKPYSNKEMKVYVYFGKFYSGLPPLDVKKFTSTLN